jgi:hypothetical protein
MRAAPRRPAARMVYSSAARARRRLPPRAPCRDCAAGAHAFAAPSPRCARPRRDRAASLLAAHTARARVVIASPPIATRAARSSAVDVLAADAQAHAAIMAPMGPAARRSSPSAQVTAPGYATHSVRLPDSMTSAARTSRCPPPGHEASASRTIRSVALAANVLRLHDRRGGSLRSPRMHDRPTHGGHPRAKQKPVFLIDMASSAVSPPPPPPPPPSPRVTSPSEALEKPKSPS